MRDGKPTKNRLLIEAFKLFAHKPYDRVTFADLEEVTGLSRGAILYHIKTKENLLRERFLVEKKIYFFENFKLINFFSFKEIFDFACSGFFTVTAMNDIFADSQRVIAADRTRNRI